jgi:tuberous sclerosis protein 2
MSSYLRLVKSEDISGIERASLWEVVRRSESSSLNPSDVAGGGGGTEEFVEGEWEARFATFELLTCGGKDIDGLMGLVGVVVEWAQEGAGGSLSSARGRKTATGKEKENQKEKEEAIVAEKKLNDSLSYLTRMLEENVGMIEDKEVGVLLDVFEGILRTCLTISSSTSATIAPTTSPPPTPQRNVSNTRGSIHRRQTSSQSTPASPPATITTSPSPQSARTPTPPPKPLFYIPAKLYLSHVSRTIALTYLPPSRLSQTVEVLVLLLSYVMTPLPTLGLGKRSPPPNELEDGTWSVLQGLLSGAFAASTTRTLKKIILPPSPTPTEKEKPSPTTTQSQTKCAHGAARSIRLALRSGAASRLARNWLDKSYDWTHSGAPVTSASAELLDLAWGRREGEGGSWEVGSVAGVLGDSVRAWVKVFGEGGGGEEVLRECFGVVEDLVDEVSLEERGFTDEEGEILGEVLKEGVELVRGMSCVLSFFFLFEKFREADADFFFWENSDANSPPFIFQLDLPLSPSQNTTLSAFATLITRIPLGSPLVPPLPQILLSLAPHLTDQTSKTLVEFYVSEGLIQPSSAGWLAILSHLFESLYLPSRPLTRRALARTAKDLYDGIRDLKEYRDPLLRLCLDIWEREDSEDDYSVISDAFAVLGDGIVAIASDEVVSGNEEKKTEDMAERIRILICDVASRYPCPYEDYGHMGPSSNDSSRSPGPSSTATPLATSPPSPMISTATSTDVSEASSPVAPKESASSIRPLMSLINSFTTSPSTRDIGPLHPPPTIRSNRPNVLILTPPVHGNACKSLTAVLTLIQAFSRLAFAPPHLLDSTSRTARAPASFQCILVFVDLLSLLAYTDETEYGVRKTGTACCPRARLAILQWVVRLRADRDHRLYVVQDLDAELEPLAAIVARAKRMDDIYTTTGPAPPPPAAAVTSEENEGGVRTTRNRSHTQVAADQGREGRERVGRSKRESSRSQSRRPAPQPTPIREPIWGIPDVLPFDVVIGTRPSEGMTTYEARTSSRAGDESSSAIAKHWLPTSTYVRTLITLLEEEKDWEIISYTLCHLPLQLANKHLFCGPMTKSAIVDFAKTLRLALHSDSFTQHIDLPTSQTLRTADVYNIAYHALTILISYRRLFDRPQLEGMIEAFIQGLARTQITAKSCLQALCLCAFELQSYMSKYISQIISKLSQINSSPALAVHILEFLYIIGSVPKLCGGLREEQYKMVFGVALKYIHLHNRPTPIFLNTSGGAQVGGLSFSLSQHVLALAYRIVYVWFSVVKAPERPRYIPFISRALVLANEQKPETDEPTEVCFDWLARNTYGNARPAPPASSQSHLGGEVAGLQEARGSKYRFGEREKTWMSGHCFVTLRTMTGLGWIEMTTRRPSGWIRFVSKLDNLSSVGSSDDFEEVSRDVISCGYHPLTLSLQESIGNSHDPESKDLPLSTTEHSNPRAPQLDLDPSFFALQVSSYPALPQGPGKWRLLPNDDSLAKTLTAIDNTSTVDMHSIAIMYVAPGQTTEVEILGNSHGSPAYTRFIDGLGRLLRLKNQHDVHIGSLDRERDEDGEYTYAWWNDLVQVVFNIATLMPNYPGDPQFTRKKQHVGNDWVRIVWNDSGKDYKFDTLYTQFQLVNVLIEPHSMGTTAAYTDDLREHEFFRVSCQRRPGMPEVGPIGEFKLVSAECLPSYVKHCVLLSSLFAVVYNHTGGDQAQDEYITVWRHRLRLMRLFKKNLVAVDGGDGGEVEDAMDGGRDFTKMF